MKAAQRNGYCNKGKLNKITARVVSCCAETREGRSGVDF